MGYYRSRRPGFLQAWQITAAELMFQGMLDDDICKKLFNAEGDEKKMRNGRQRLRNLRHNEKFIEYYQSIVTEWSVHNVGRALNKLSQQIDDPNPWMANKAANDVLNQSKHLISNADDNTVTLRIEGMPDLGTPDQEES